MAKRKPQPTKLEAGIIQLKIRACEMRSMELYYRAEADRLEACIRLLQPLRFAESVRTHGLAYVHGLIMKRNETAEQFEARVLAYSEEQTRKVKR